MILVYRRRCHKRWKEEGLLRMTETIVDLDVNQISGE
jgi:hypothetical protein